MGFRYDLLKHHTKQIHCMKCDGDVLYTGSSDCFLKIWDVKTGTCKKTIVLREPVFNFEIVGDTFYVNHHNDIIVWVLKVCATSSMIYCIEF